MILYHVLPFGNLRRTCGFCRASFTISETSERKRPGRWVTSPGRTKPRLGTPKGSWLPSRFPWKKVIAFFHVYEVGKINTQQRLKVINFFLNVGKTRLILLHLKGKSQCPLAMQQERQYPAPGHKESLGTSRSCLASLTRCSSRSPSRRHYMYETYFGDIHLHWALKPCQL